MTIFRKYKCKHKMITLFNKMYDNMTEKDFFEVAEHIGYVYKLLPDYRKEEFLDEMHRVLKNVCNI